MNEDIPRDLPKDYAQMTPQEKERERAVMAIQELLDMGLTEKAKQLDKLKGVGFFKSISKAKIILDTFITLNPEMLRLKEQVLKIAEPDILDPVLILGETGTGKELLAKALHADKKGNFIEINCAGLPEHLIESELFGYADGSFTGASKGGRAGLIEMAGKDGAGNESRGTLFLDEIGELPLGVQAKLLRVLNDKRIRRVGDNVYRSVDFRLVAATHQAIDKENCLTFRRDLYHRISVIEFKTLPLRERREDIEPIMNNLLPGSYKLLHGTHIKDNTLGGNVRDLQKLVRRHQLGIL